MARNPVFLLLHNFEQKKAIAAEFTSLIVAVYSKISVEYTLNKLPRFLLLNLRLKKTDFKWFAGNDRNFFCSTTSNFAGNFTPGKQPLRT